MVASLKYLAHVCAHELDLLVEVPRLEGVADADSWVHWREIPRDAPVRVVQLAEGVGDTALQGARNLFQIILVTSQAESTFFTLTWEYFMWAWRFFSSLK